MYKREKWQHPCVASLNCGASILDSQHKWSASAIAAPKQVEVSVAWWYWNKLGWEEGKEGPFVWTQGKIRVQECAIGWMIQTQVLMKIHSPLYVLMPRAKERFKTNILSGLRLCVSMCVCVCAVVLSFILVFWKACCSWKTSQSPERCCGGVGECITSFKMHSSKAL